METEYKELPRERRRRDHQRMKAKARRIFTRGSTGGLEFWRSPEDRDRWLLDCEKLADHLAHCKRRCCNRARDWEGLTRQERIWAIATKDINHEF